MTSPTSTRELRFSVIGVPAPQGSKSFKGRSASGKPIMVESSRKVKPWRSAVSFEAAQAARQRGWRATDGPLEVVVQFYLPRPPSVPRSRRLPTVAPDLDKLLRSTLDALTDAGVIVDDSRVVRIEAEKYYASPARPQSGAVITISEV